MRRKIHLVCRGISIVVLQVVTFVASKLLRFKLWLNNVECGRNVSSGGGGLVSLQISPYARKVRLGDNVGFNNYESVGWFANCSLWVKKDATLVIGNNSGLSGTLVFAAQSIIIGNNVKIGGGSRIFDTDCHPIDYMARRHTNDGTKTKPIVIEDDVFIGAGCIVMKGVQIGKRSIIAAGSVVTGTIPSDELWGGCPAKFIRKLNHEESHSC